MTTKKMSTLLLLIIPAVLCTVRYLNGYPGFGRSFGGTSAIFNLPLYYKDKHQDTDPYYYAIEHEEDRILQERQPKDSIPVAYKRKHRRSRRNFEAELELEQLRLERDRLELERKKLEIELAAAL